MQSKGLFDKLFNFFSSGYTSPREFHFIWLGSRSMPDANLSNVAEWLIQHPNFKLNLWGENYFKTPSELRADYQQRLMEILRKEHRMPEEEAKSLLEGRLFFRSPDELFDKPGYQQYEEYYRYELDRMVPNYGCASDILRQIILYEHGGCYLDSDIKPGEERLDNVNPFGSLKQHQLGIHADAFGEKNMHSNDFIISTQNNPLVLSTLKNIIKAYNAMLTGEKISEPDSRTLNKFLPGNLKFLTRYQVIDSDVNKYNTIETESEMLAYNSATKQYTVDSTLHKTGPGQVRLAICDHFMRQEASEANQSAIYRINPLSRVCDVDIGNSWIRLRPRNFPLYADALAAVKQSMAFEAKHYTVLRLDDHIDHLKELFKDKPAAEIEHDVFTLADQQLAESGDKIKVIQSVSSPSYDYCAEKALLDKTYLHPSLDGLINENDRYINVMLAMESFVRGFLLEDELREEFSKGETKTLDLITDDLTRVMDILNRTLLQLEKIMGQMPSETKSHDEINSISRYIECIEHIAGHAGVSSHTAKDLLATSAPESIKEGYAEKLANLEERAKAVKGKCKLYQEQINSLESSPTKSMT